MNPLVTAFIGAGVRWLITAAAAREIALSEDEATRILSGAVAVGMLLWSWYQKRRTDIQFEDAKKGLF